MKTRIQTPTIENHAWTPMREHTLTAEEEDEILLSDREPQAYARVLPHLKPGEYLEVAKIPATQRNVSYLQNFMDALRREGIDVGRGTAPYGFKMPLPEEGKEFRDLIIFRRGVKE